MRRIRAVVFDCDGVLTDGGIHIGPDGREFKTFNVHDGTGIKYLLRVGLQVAILSGRSADAVTHRAQELGIEHVVQGCKVKTEGLTDLLQRMTLNAEAVCFVGDDLTDIPVMRQVGLAVAVANARPEVLCIAHWSTRTPGGSGAAREVAERILKVQGKWEQVIARYGLAESPADRRS